MIPTVAFGSADHHIHYYDIRNIRDDGLFVFKGHAKAVSYVKFLNADELVSASTDSTLKQWCTKDLQCKRTYTGHTNEKNFVGLSTSNDFIACGSENNAVYCYYKSLSKPVICHKFTKERTTDADDAEDTANFVSSVCWKKNSNVLLAANSLGTISVRVCLALMLRACAPLSLLRSVLLFARCCCITHWVDLLLTFAGLVILGLRTPPAPHYRSWTLFEGKMIGPRPRPQARRICAQSCFLCTQKLIRRSKGGCRGSLLALDILQYAGDSGGGGGGVSSPR